MEELISKKELLEIMNISYGQLYRWKRKQIIPEAWFIKKAVPSGQETFFPKHKIIERIQTILNKKEESSLDQLAQLFNSEIESDQIHLEKLIEVGLLNEESVRLYKQATGKMEIQYIYEFVGAKLFKDEVMTSNITLEEGRLVDSFIATHYDVLNNEQARVYLLRQMGTPFVVGSKNHTDIILDQNYRRVMAVNIYKEVQGIKMQVMDQ